MTFQARLATRADEASIFTLYQTVAQGKGGIAREQDEITPTYISQNLEKSLVNGVCVVVPHPEMPDLLLAEVHCYKLEPRTFHHVLSELTIVVHPDFQGNGLGKLVFTTLLDHVQTQRLDILRVELIARESNKKAIAFYQKLGFQIEGKLQNRVYTEGIGFEADIPMAWFPSRI